MYIVYTSLETTVTAKLVTTVDVECFQWLSISAHGRI